MRLASLAGPEERAVFMIFTFCSMGGRKPIVFGVIVPEGWAQSIMSSKSKQKLDIITVSLFHSYEIIATIVVFFKSNIEEKHSPAMPCADQILENSCEESIMNIDSNS